MISDVSEATQKPAPLKLILSGVLLTAPAIWLEMSNSWMETALVPQIGPIGDRLLIFGAILYLLIVSAIITRLFRGPESEGLGFFYFGFGAIVFAIICIYLDYGTQQAFYGMYEFATQKESVGTAYYPVLRVNSHDHYVLHSKYETWAVSKPYNIKYISLPSNRVDFEKAASKAENSLCYPIKERRAGSVRKFLIPDMLPETGLLVPCV